jgi:hypothetical protein
VGVANVGTSPITIYEFDKLRLTEDRSWELRGEKVVEVPFARLVHKRLQLRMTDLLRHSNADVLPQYPFSD